MLRKILGISCLFGNLSCGIAMLYYPYVMIKNVKPEHKTKLRFLGPAMLILPQLWNKDGDKARVNTIIFAILFLIFFGGMAAVDKYFPV